MTEAQDVEKTSSQLFRVIEEDLILDSEVIIFDWIEDSFDGIFPRVSDYKRLANRMDNYGVAEFLTWISLRNKKTIASTGYCTIERESKWDSKATITFTEPITVKFAQINEEQITGKVNRITGEFSLDWFWMKNGRQNEIANAFEIYFKCDQYFNDSITNT